ncbi:MAG: glycosyltransferase family 9 protein [Bacteroidetes bacterium]|jgi:heptosyltransferase-2|nr:glycosyltransferase family 9 protein [Bacteroidota bacterium]
MKFLIIQTAFIGDVVLATPLIEKLHQFYPDARIDFLVRKGNESLLHNHPHLNSILIFDKQKKKYHHLYRLIGEIRAASYDYVINVQRFFTTGIITALSKGKKTVGFHKNPLSLFFSKVVRHEISMDQNGMHEVERNLRLIDEITDTRLTRPRLYPTDEDYKSVPTSDNYICIAPASVWFTKQFPAKRWIGLIDQISEEYNIYLIGAPDDRPLCAEIKQQSRHKHVEIMAGKLSLLQSAALMEKATMNFVNDSAPLHFASSVNAPVTAIYCSTVPAFGFGPLSQTSYVMETHHHLHCRPCGLTGKKTCPQGHFKCSEIDTTSILKTIGLI